MPKKSLFRSGSERNFAAGLKGALQGYLTHKELKSQDSALALKQQAEDRERQTTRLLGEISLLKEGRPSSIYDPISGQQTTIPGIQDVSIGEDLRLNKGPNFSLGPKAPKVLTQQGQEVIVDPDTMEAFNATGQRLEYVPPNARIKFKPRVPGGANAAKEALQVDAQLNNLKSIETLLSDVNAGPRGVWDRTKSFVTGGAESPAAKQYEDLRAAMAVGLYRSITGDVRLSDDDAKKRALPLLPGFYDDPVVRKGKLDFIRQSLMNKKGASGGGSRFIIEETQ